MTANETLNTVNDIANKGMERINTLGELNLRIFERMAAKQMDTMGLLMEHASRMMKLATDAKGYNDFFKGQVEATKDLSERVVTESKAGLALVGEARDDYRAWFEKSLAEVSADLRKATPAA